MKPSKDKRTLLQTLYSYTSVGFLPLAWNNLNQIMKCFKIDLLGTCPVLI